MNAPKINTSIKYSEFGSINGNRNINRKKVDAIKKDIENGLNLLPYAPIIVYPEGNLLMIVDGQHRFIVSSELDLPVYYVLSDKLTLQQMALINNRQDKWTMHDFLRCYIKIGIEDYKTLKTLMDKYLVGISTAVDLLMLGKISKQGKSSQTFRSGEFKINFLEETKDLLDLNNSLFDRYKFYKDRNLITAVQEIKAKGKCDFEILKEKIAAAPNIMDKQVSVKDYIFNIERVYNHRSVNRKVIF